MDNVKKNETFGDVLRICIETDTILAAHLIFYAIQKGTVAINDLYDSDFIKQLDDADYLIVRDMTKEDYLKVRIIKLYAVPLDTTSFAFYFAKSAQDITEIHKKQFHRVPSKIINAQRMMIQELWFPDTNTFKSFLDIKRETVHYPALVCVLEKR